MYIIIIFIIDIRVERGCLDHIVVTRHISEINCRAYVLWALYNLMLMELTLIFNVFIANL